MPGYKKNKLLAALVIIPTDENVVLKYGAKKSILCTIIGRNF